MAMTAKERQKLRRERLRAEGKKQMIITLDPDVSEKLADKCDKEGLTYSQGINALLRESAPTTPASTGTTGDEETFRKTYHAFLKEVSTAKENNWESVPYGVGCELIGSLNQYI